MRARGVLRTIAFVDLVPHLDNPEGFARAVREALQSAATAPDQGAKPARLSKALLHPLIRASPGFVAREQQLMAIERALRSADASSYVAIVSLAGMGGVGKSELARQYAWQFQDAYSGVWWLRASDRDSLIDDLIELGATYMPGLPRTIDRAQAAHPRQSRHCRASG